ncbi:MAG TPA: ROK family transcriptional regulator [Candidatus Fournierella pullicola]|uniref:ROK family transcriptional regulator n=1 Tax=Candidatus Allofournierella pullicola TaxID=2838596 RepID=A0A9D2ACY2_9FIRM|nr:ROK family transcriptional regulator [Candidatus Fournierella pullicola]
MELITQQIIRSENLRRIYHLIDRNANISRASLAGITSLSKTTVSSLVDELIRGGYVVDCGAGVSAHQGRRPNALQVDGASNVVAVISWRRTRLDIALVSSDSRLVYRGQTPLRTPSEGVEQICRAFFDILLPAAKSARIMGVCVIIPGIVEEERQSLFSTVIGVDPGDPVVPRLRQALAGFPLCFLNDTACLGYAERVFTPPQDPYMAYVNVSRGVGACLFAKERMLRGAGAMATQFGHFSIDRSGPVCDCGNRGCLECLVGENALGRRAAEHGMEVPGAEGRLLFSDVAAMADAGDEKARALIADLGRDLAYGISNLISLFNPSLVVVGGTGVNLGPAFLDSVRTALAGMGFPAFVSRVRVEYSRLGLDAELTGAARYYIDTHYDFSGNTQQQLFLR